MKRILVFSDSHCDTVNMMQVIEKKKPDMIIHLGDCVRDAQTLRITYPKIPVENVPGNCDFSSDPAIRILDIEGKKIMICHGHQFHVKEHYRDIEYAALERGVDAVLFGHSHVLHYDLHNGLLILNPGSIALPRYAGGESYAMLFVDSDTLKAETYQLKNL